MQAGQHGLHLEYLRGMGALGYATGSLAPLITLRDHGVAPEFGRALADAGFTGLSLDQLVRMRDHRMTADRIQQANARAGGRQSVEALLGAALGRPR